uniref:Uncharacterized protein n=1 Tax=Ascaris lumbricoides TaxID=6252 RepID=A0A0M3IQ67_ASCLU
MGTTFALGSSEPVRHFYFCKTMYCISNIGTWTQEQFQICVPDANLTYVLLHELRSGTCTPSSQDTRHGCHFSQVTKKIKKDLEERTIFGAASSTLEVFVVGVAFGERISNMWARSPRLRLPLSFP